MTLNQLQNLVKVKQLKPEPPDQVEFCNLVSSAKRQLQDARVEGLSIEGRFSFAYSAAHALSLAAMRWHGYRSDNRYLVFQCLQHTVGLEAAKQPGGMRRAFGSGAAVVSRVGQYNRGAFTVAEAARRLTCFPFRLFFIRELRMMTVL